MRRIRIRLPWVLMETVSLFAKQKVLAETIIPADACPGWVEPEVFQPYARGKPRVCADVVSISTHLGKPTVLLSRRKGKPMKGHWWVQGGGISGYVPVDRFLQWAFLRECGLLPAAPDDLTDFKFAMKIMKDLSAFPDTRRFRVPCLIGVYRAPLNELPDAFVPVGLGIIKKSLVPKIGHDRDHDQIRWATEYEIRRDKHLHPYVQHIVLRAFKVFREYFA